MTLAPQDPVVEITGVVKHYAGLRPLRLASLVMNEGERVALSGLDAAAAELFVNLITGSSLPEEGTIRVFGRSTADIANGDEWLASLDRFGIASDRAVLLEGTTLAGNLAMPFTLEIDPMSAETLARVSALAAECGIDARWLDRAVAEAPAAVRARAHLARAVALSPSLLLAEHPTAMVPEADRRALAEDVARLVRQRALTTLVITADAAFAQAVAERVLTLEPATGKLVAAKKRGRWW
jgi:ABC-type transporter Mla maintaining outer membrane lipid asymmetry ATPase subunit MlaF